MTIMNNVKIVVDKSYKIAKIGDEIFSSFIEHLGRAVYTGIYEPKHSAADEKGFRRDVIELVKGLNLSLVRYPGGNFLSGYNWRDGIGPLSERPRRLDLAWRTTESNEIGIDEFADWAKKAGVGILGAINMGTGTPKEAAELLEYCNHPGGTTLSDLRIKNGHKNPHNIKTWCIGNEMDGYWQIGHLDADDYGKKARETAKIMKLVDPSVKLVVCGSTSPEMPTYPAWDRIVLEHTYQDVDYLSLHRYYENHGNDTDFLASFLDMDRFIKSVCSTADYVKALKRSKKTMDLCFDEWNVWYQSQVVLPDWEEAPEILEDRYTLLDALCFAGLGMTLINNSDRVKIACLAQLVNVIAPIITKKGGEAVKQTIYYPFELLSKYGRGTALKVYSETETIETKHGDAPKLYISAVHNEENDELNVFALNISSEDIKIETDMRSLGEFTLKEQIIQDLSNIRKVSQNSDMICPGCSFSLFRF